MAHYAILDDNNVVVQVIVGIENDERDWEDYYGGKQTSYNTRGGVHYGQDGNPDSGTALRKNYAGIGFIYDSTRDAFYEPKPYPSWTLNETSCLWEPPTAMPDDDNLYKWDEDTTAWVVWER